MKNILVIIDAQNDFINGSLANPVAQERVPAIAELINTAGWDNIVFTRDTHGKNYLSSAEGLKLPVEHCIRGTHGWEINSDLIAAINDNAYNEITTYYDKETFGAHQLPYFLKSFIREGELAKITFCGFCTDICVISNVLITKSMYFETADITVMANACAGVTPEKHDAALSVMESCQINVDYRTFGNVVEDEPMDPDAVIVNDNNEATDTVEE